MPKATPALAIALALVLPVYFVIAIAWTAAQVVWALLLLPFGLARLVIRGFSSGE